MPELRILCFGAGAIGTYLGGSLALSGQKVVFVERPQVAAELRERGLRLRLLDGEHDVPQAAVVPALSEAVSEGPFDAAIFAVKSFDTPALLESILPYRTQMPPFLSIQNGVDNETQILAALGPEKVIPATLTSAVGRRAAGDIVLERLRGVGIAGDNPLSQRLVAAFNQAGLTARLYGDAAAMKWSKMLTNLVGNASSAILDMTPAEIFAHPGLFQLEVRQLAETLRVMAAQRIAVVNLPGTPVRLLAAGVKFLPPALLQPLLLRAVGSGRGGKMPSFHIDLHSGRGQSEVGYLNGAVVRHGSRLNIPTPVNRLLMETLTALTGGSERISDWARRPEKLLALVNSSIS